ncbi:MAG: hypothetical protein MUO42_11310 [Anaerolineaceae bacterium]|nr:hypothetical protein [Anaerolineaceae bacterium]
MTRSQNPGQDQGNAGGIATKAIIARLVSFWLVKNKMLKNILRGTLLILVLFLFLFLGQKNTVKGVDYCNVNAQDCDLRVCNGHSCPGTCMLTDKWICDINDQPCCWTKSCSGEYSMDDCNCNNEVQVAQCY